MPRQLHLARRFILTVVVSGMLAAMFVLVFASRAQAQRDSFDALVKGLKSHDGVETTTPPMMWLGRMVVRAMQPEGVLDVRLATFEGRGLSRVATDGSFGKLLQRVSDNGWSPIVRVHSRRSGEMSAVHVRHDRKTLSLLVLAINSADAVVVEVSIQPEALSRWLNEPTSIVRRAYAGTH
jgi:hypothetical protein